LKRIQLSFLLCILLMFNLITIAHAKSSLANGFHGLTWGQALNDFSEKNSMQDVSAPLRGKELGKDEFAYKRFNHDNVIGGVSSFDIFYFFWQNKFEAVSAYSQGYDKFDELAEFIKKRLGNPTLIETNPCFNRLVWRTARAEIVLTISGDEHFVQFYMKSLIIEKEKDVTNKQLGLPHIANGNFY
jgi:hypothetical protein